jgi:hypothetical protein
MDRRELERYWKDRWHNAKLDLDAARTRVDSLKHDAASALGPDGGYAYAAYARAMMNETAALIEYSKILRIYTDLVVHGKLPDEPQTGDQ